MFCNLVHLAENDLAQIPAHAGHPGNLAPKVIDPCTDPGEPGGRAVHMVPDDLSQAFQG